MHPVVAGHGSASPYVGSARSTPDPGRLGCSPGRGRIHASVVHGICFHGIGTPLRVLDSGEERYWISVDAFHRILDAIAAVEGVRLSFDDGNASDVEVALPGLLERGLTGSFFVVAGRIGSSGSLDADGIVELSRHGMTIGSHGMNHRPWRRLSAEERDQEFVAARERIVDVLGHPVTEAALPTGAYDRRVLRDLRRLGYSAVHTSDRRAAKAGAWLQPRFSVVSKDTPETVLAYTRRPSALGRVGPAVGGFLKSVR
jgi:peptidoglycan/xylan/chitin deacetylase (PgdA/CDA1 family)